MRETTVSFKMSSGCATGLAARFYMEKSNSALSLLIYEEGRHVATYKLSQIFRPRIRDLNENEFSLIPRDGPIFYTEESLAIGRTKTTVYEYTSGWTMCISYTTMFPGFQVVDNSYKWPGTIEKMQENHTLLEQ